MMRTPSLFKPYDEFYSGDPAIIQPPANATEDQIAQHVAKLRVARETGNWADIIVPGQTPTKFQLVLLDGEQLAALHDYTTSGGGEDMAATSSLLHVRAALHSVSGFPHPDTGDNWRVTHHVDPRYPALGVIADRDVTNAIWAIKDEAGTLIGPFILRELCLLIKARANGLLPKS